MSIQTTEAFRKSVVRMRLLKSSTVVVGLSGSSDSVALAYLAKRTFPRVLAMTVDLNMNGETSPQTEETAKIAQSLGLEHHVIPLNWSTEGKRKTLSIARFRRYPALMDQCRKVGAGILMVGHNQDDQIETVVYRLSKSSGLEGLGGLSPLTHWAAYPDVGVVRPFLNCPRETIEEMCRELELPWLEKESNQSEREMYLAVPRKHTELKEGVLELMTVCREARDLVQPQVSRTVKKLPAIDMQHGSISFPTTIYRSMNQSVARRVLSLWIRYVGGVSDVRYDILRPMERLLNSYKTTNVTVSSVILAVDAQRQRACLARRSPDSRFRKVVAIRPGETIFWDNRFSISLVPRNPTGPNDKEKSVGLNPPEEVGETNEEGEEEEEGERAAPVFYVRHMVEKDWMLMSKGAARTKVPVVVRGGLPVIVDKHNNIVSIPHFKVASREANVMAVVRFRPARTLEDLLHYSHYHEC